MTRTVERIFARLHTDGLLVDHYPEDYTFHRHRLKPHDLSAGAMRWTLLPNRQRGATGPTITSAFTVNDICRAPVQRYVDACGKHAPEFEILPQ